MGPCDALSLRRAHPQTPLNPLAWHTQLERHGLSFRYHRLFLGLSLGFRVDAPLIQHTFAPLNSHSLNTLRHHFDTIVNNEFRKNRYIGPFSQRALESLIGPFQTSPLSLVPKPHKPNAYRLVQNFSFPRAPRGNTFSVNHHIDSDRFPCTWGTFPAFALLVWHLPEGSQAAVRDVAEAYRSIPLHPSQWPSTVVRISDADEFAVDTCSAFGMAPSGGIFGYVADAGADIMRANGIGPLVKWVDDHVFVRVKQVHRELYNRRRSACGELVQALGGRHHSGGRYWFGGYAPDSDFLFDFCENFEFPLLDLAGELDRPVEDAGFCYGISDIDRISRPLGIQWEPSKDVPFSEVFPFTGFEWNLREKTVALTAKKRDKYLTAIESWLERPAHTLEDVQRLHGKLQHSALVIPEGRAYLPNLERMLGIFHDQPFKPRHAPKGTNDDLRWWLQRLQQSPSRPVPGPLPFVDLPAYSDASSGFGLGIVLGGRWRAWRLLPGWQNEGRDIGWAEAVGFELLVLAILALPGHPQHFRVQGDNQGVIEGWRGGKSRNREVNNVFRRIAELQLQRNVSVRCAYTRSADNPADDPSRGRYPHATKLLPPVILPACLRPWVVNFDDPLTPAERQRTRNTSHSIPKARSTTSTIHRHDDGAEQLERFLHQGEAHDNSGF